MKHSKVVTTNTETTLVLTGDDIIAAILAKFELPIPRNAVVSIRVPSVGDCSSYTLEIVSACPVTISWSKVNREVG